MSDQPCPACGRRTRETVLAPGESDVVPTLHAAANIRDILEAASKTLYEYGTIEGMLEVISTHNGDSFTIWEKLTNHRVECKASEKYIEQAKSLLRRRVAVTGKIKYHQRTKPVSMQVESLRALRPSSELPQPAAMAPIDLTGGLASEDYVGKLRDD